MPTRSGRTSCSAAAQAGMAVTGRARGRGGAGGAGAGPGAGDPELDAGTGRVFTLTQQRVWALGAVGHFLRHMEPGIITSVCNYLFFLPTPLTAQSADTATPLALAVAIHSGPPETYGDAHDCRDATSDDVVVTCEVLRGLRRHLPASVEARHRLQPVLPWVHAWARHLASRSCTYNPGVKRHAVTQLSLFLSTWYFVPPDSLLWHFPRHKEHLLTGYAKRRRLSLLTQMQDKLGFARPGSGVPQTPDSELRDYHELRRTRLAARALRDVEIDDSAGALVNPELLRALKAGDVSALVPAAGELSFPDATTELVFRSGMRTQTLMLANASSVMTHWFWLQAVPCDVFTVVPAFGRIRPGARVSVTVTFQEEAIAALHYKHPVQGRVWLRSGGGFPLQRLSLLGYPPAWLEVYTTHVDFGRCPRGQQRDYTLVAKNVGSTPTAVHPGLYPPHPEFMVTPSTCHVAPGASAVFTITFRPKPATAHDDGGGLFGRVRALSPRSSGDPLHGIRRTSIVLSSGDATDHSVTLQGTIGPSFEMEETAIDFGATALPARSTSATSAEPVGTYSRLLHLDSRDPERDTHITFQCSSAEVIVPPATVPAGGSCAVPVTFKPCLEGPWTGHLRVLSATGTPKTIRLRSFVGSYAAFAVSRRVHMPPTLSGTRSSVVLPLVNLWDREIEVQLDGVSSSGPFSFYLLDFTATDGDDGGVSDVASSLLSVRTRGVKSLVVSLLKNQVRHLLVTFEPQSPGLYEENLELHVTAPVRTHTKPWTLYAASFSPPPASPRPGKKPATIATPDEHSNEAVLRQLRRGHCLKAGEATWLRSTDAAARRRLKWTTSGRLMGPASAGSSTKKRKQSMALLGAIEESIDALVDDVDSSDEEGVEAATAQPRPSSSRRHARHLVEEVKTSSGGGTTAAQLFNAHPGGRRIMSLSCRRLSLFMDANSARPWAEITLTNRTRTPQSYHLVLSKPFLTNAEVDGRLRARQSLSILLWLRKDGADPIPSADQRTPVDNIAIGYIAVLNDVLNLEAVAHLTGVFGYEITVTSPSLRNDTKSDASKLAAVMKKFGKAGAGGAGAGRPFRRGNMMMKALANRVSDKPTYRLEVPSTLVRTATSTWLFVVNRGGRSVPVHVRILKGKSGKSQEAQQLQTAPVFTLEDGTTTSRFTLAPYARQRVSIRFFPRVQGSYAGRVEVIAKVRNPDAPDRFHEARMLVAIIEGVAGYPKMSTNPARILDFGEVEMGESKELQIMLRNHSLLATVGHAFAPRPFHVTPIAMDMPPSKADGKPSTKPLKIHFSPRWHGLVSQQLLVMYGDHTTTLQLIGKSGTLALTSNFGQPWDDANPSTHTLGVMDSHGVRTFDFVVINSGSMALEVQRVTCSHPDVSCAALHVLTSTGVESTDMKSMHTAHVVSAYKSDLNQGFTPRLSLAGTPFIDWDEVDHGRTHVRRGPTLRDGPTRDGSILLRPSERASCTVTWIGRGQASRSQIELQVWCRPASRTKARRRVDGMDAADLVAPRFRFCLESVLQPPPTIMDPFVDFDVIPLGAKHVKSLWFRNPGLVPVEWHVVVRRGPQRASTAMDESGAARFFTLPDEPEKSDDSSDDAEESDSDTEIGCTVFPEEGVLARDTSQMVNITFDPLDVDVNKRCHYRVYVIAKGIEPGEPALVEGIGGTSQLAVGRPATAERPEVPPAEAVEVDFGCIRARSGTTTELEIVNTGWLPASFTVKGVEDLTCFVVAPLTGTVPGKGTAGVTVTFTPPEADIPYDGLIKIEWTPVVPADNPDFRAALTKHTAHAERTPLRVGLSGIGGFPSLQVKTHHLDFDPAMLYTDTSRTIRLFNNGSAEAMVQCCILTEEMANEVVDIGLDVIGELTEEAKAVDNWPWTIESGGTLIVHPHSYRDVTVTCHPRSTGDFDGALMVYVMGGDGDFARVRVTSRVDAPLLSVLPHNAFSGLLEFGVVLEKRMHIRSFTVTNDGMSLDYECVFMRPKPPPAKQKAGRDKDLLQRARRGSADLIRPSTTAGSKRSRPSSAGSRVGRSRPVEETTVEGYGAWKAAYDAAPEKFEVFDPDDMEVTPRSGTLERNQDTVFNVRFRPDPKKTGKLCRALLVMRNPFLPIVVEVQGTGGATEMEFDIPSRVVDFGLCAIGSTFHRTIHVLNPGTIGYQFKISPDPTDSGLLFSRQVTAALRRAVGRSRARMYSHGSADTDLRTSFTEHDVIEEGSEGESSDEGEPESKRRESRKYLQPRAPRRPRLVNDPRSAGGGRGSRLLGLVESMVGPTRSDPGLEVWRRRMKNTLGFAFETDHFCAARSTCAIRISFTPRAEEAVSCRLLISHSMGSAIVTLTGWGGRPELSLLGDDLRPVPTFAVWSESRQLAASFGSSSSQQGAVVPAEIRSAKNALLFDIGATTVGCTLTRHLWLYNVGNMTSEFQLTVPAVAHFVANPTRGKVPPGEKLPITLEFAPTHVETQWMLARLRLANAGISYNLAVTAKAFRGEPQIVFLAEEDVALNSLDFGVVPIHASVLKHFVVGNDAEVALNVTLLSSSQHFTFWRTDSKWHNLGDIAGLAETYSKPQDLDVSDEAGTHATTALNIRVPPRTATVVTACFTAVDESVCVAKMKAVATGAVAGAPATTFLARATGGTVVLGHEPAGGCHFGSIAANQEYQRRLVISNSGSLPTEVALHWEFPDGESPGHDGSGNPDEATVRLHGYNTKEGFRRLWQRAGSTVRQAVDSSKSELRSGASMSSFGSSVLLDWKKSGSHVSPRACMAAEGDDDPRKPPAARQLAARGMEIGRLVHDLVAQYQDFQEREARHTSAQEYDSLRRMAIGESKDDLPPGAPFVRVTPATGNASKRLQLEVVVSLLVASTKRFVATLVVTPSVPGVPPYRIRVTAAPTESELHIDDAGCLHFGRQPIGRFVAMNRVLSNHGSLPIRFAIKHTNTGLTAEPMAGLIGPGQSQRVKFVFRAIDTSMQLAPVIVQTDCTKPLELRVRAGGGVPKLILDQPHAMDFGRCMLHRSLNRELSLHNGGTADLVIDDVLIRSASNESSSAFGKGLGWPHTPLVIPAGAASSVPVTFRPTVEKPYSSLLTIQMGARSRVLRLSGTGREALMSLSKDAINFERCISGNSYKTSITVHNKGDLAHQVTASLSSGGDVLTVTPTEFRLPAFGSVNVEVKFEPRDDLDKRFSLVFQSRLYASCEVPVSVMSGTAILMIEPKELDFGNVPFGNRSQKTLRITNAGNVETQFKIRRRVRDALADLAAEPPNSVEPATMRSGAGAGAGAGADAESSTEAKALAGVKPGMDTATIVAASSAWFRLSQWEGRLAPGQRVEVIATYSSRSGVLSDELLVNSERLNDTQFVPVRAVCERAELDESLLHPITFNAVQVGNRATAQLVLRNIGNMPLKATLSASQPLKLSTESVAVEPSSRALVSVTWRPSGEFSLRGSVSIETSDATRVLQVTGKGVLPQFDVSPQIVRFGAVALGDVRELSIRIKHAGVVPVAWSVPKIGPCFTVMPEFGTLYRFCADLEAEERRSKSAGGHHTGATAAGFQDVVITFTPKAEPKLYESSFVVQCGSRYTTIDCVGFGGHSKLEVTPPILSLGERSAGGRVGTDVRLTNSGNVPLRWEAQLPSTASAAGDRAPSLALHPHRGSLRPGQAANILVLTSAGLSRGTFTMTSVLHGSAYSPDFARLLEDSPSAEAVVAVKGTVSGPKQEGTEPAAAR